MDGVQLTAALTDRDPHVRAAALHEIDRTVTAAGNAMRDLDDSGALARLATLAAELVDADAVIAACLDDDNPVVAVAAATALGQLVCAGAAGWLPGGADDAARIRVAALGARCAPTLIRAAAIGPAALRAAATTALGHIAADDDVLRARLRDDAPEVRASAARALVRRSGDHPVAAVIALQDDPDVTVRELAIAHGSQHGDASVAPALLARLRELAAEELGPPRTTSPIYLTADEEPASATDALEWLDMLGVHAVPEALPIVLALLTRGRRPSLSLRIALVLTSATDDACVDPLCALLPARDPTAGYAAITLGRMRATRAAGPLAAALDGPGTNPGNDGRVRGAMARALASIGAREYVARIDALPAGQCDDAVIDALVRLGSLTAAPRARRALDDDRAGVLAAARALGRCGDDRDLERLRRALTHRQPAVREAATVSLATLSPTPDALGGLRDLDGPLSPVDLLELAHAWLALLARVPAARAAAAAFLARAHDLLDIADRRRRGLGAWTTEETRYLYEARDVVEHLARHAHEP